MSVSAAFLGLPAITIDEGNMRRKDVVIGVAMTFGLVGAFILVSWVYERLFP